MRTLLFVFTALPLLAGVDFESKVRPILVGRCYACHSAATKPAGFLRVDDRTGFFRGGDSGPAVVPGKPEASLLLQRIEHADPRRRMPRESPALSAEEIATLKTWIAEGAEWPVETLTVTPAKNTAGYPQLRAKHWAFQPVQNPAPPAVANRAWPATPVDQFLLAKLEQKQLKPVGDADRLTLVRRLTYDLTGLPPTPAEVDAFLADKSPQAYAKLVDRLLASPRFGERWGRHWLDVARYGESSGPSRNIPYPHAWRYRDYVLDAVNRDVPYNQFLREQIAGDLLPAATPAERDRLLIATGFLALGPKDVNQRFKERFQMDNVAEQIDTVTRSTIALTVSCARCHDHKFDPIPTADYYALAGIFTSTDDAAGVRNKMGGAGLDYYDPAMLLRHSAYQPKADPATLSRLEADLATAKAEWEAIRGTPEGLKIAANGRPTQQPFRLKYEKLQKEWLSLTDHGTLGFAIHGVRDAKQIADTNIRVRGEAELLGPLVPRGFLTSFAVPDAPPLNRAQSGRLELAQWLTSDRNPLTPRVVVNRIWQHLYGEGLVKTVDNFGLTGDRPSHPELLDYLASQFVADGWSVKKTVRRLVLSRSYRLASTKVPANGEVDPANRLVWRHAPRRLDAEEVRDSILLSSGRLQLNPPPASPAQGLSMIEMRDNGPESRAIIEQADGSLARSVYLPLLRGVTPRALEAFDPVTQTLVTGQRDATTVPTQALFLMNSTFVRQQSLALASELLAQTGSEADRIRQAYRRILNRLPTPQELDRAASFVHEYAAAYRPPAPSPVAPPVAAKPVVNPATPADPDNIDRTDIRPAEPEIRPANAQAAAWMSFAQALYASAEFRFVL
jgi:hypothetical protein